MVLLCGQNRFATYASINHSVINVLPRMSRLRLGDLLRWIKSMLKILNSRFSNAEKSRANRFFGSTQSSQNG